MLFPLPGSPRKSTVGTGASLAAMVWDALRRLNMLDSAIPFIRDGISVILPPQGALFRKSAEGSIRQALLEKDMVEAVIGLAPNLFYGTGIPACVLVINKDGASKRKSVLFINADLEFKEGKNQNSLRPEDIEKITHVYHKQLTVPKYSRNVPIKELEGEDFNLNIRRYVDNSPPPEPHDVRAHLHGGVPVAEVDQATVGRAYSPAASRLAPPPKRSTYQSSVSSRPCRRSWVGS